MRWRLGGRHRGDRDGPRAKSKLALVPVIAIVRINAGIAILCIDPVNPVISFVLAGASVTVTACGSPGDSSDRSFPDL